MIINYVEYSPFYDTFSASCCGCNIDINHLVKYRYIYNLLKIKKYNNKNITFFERITLVLLPVCKKTKQNAFNLVQWYTICKTQFSLYAEE